MEMNTNTDRPPFSYGEGILLIVGFLAVSLVFAGFVALVNTYPNSIALPMLSVVGIILLLLFLAAIAYVFTRTGLQDRSQALGLPPGSIQAVIALSLIVLFAILSTFVFTSLGDPSIRSITGLSEADRDKQITQLAASFAGWQPESAGKFTVFVREPSSDARNDIGKQLIVLIGTLMTSAVSFYFGSKATAAGAAAVNSDGPEAIPVAVAPLATQPPDAGGRDASPPQQPLEPH